MFGGFHLTDYLMDDKIDCLRKWSDAVSIKEKHCYVRARAAAVAKVPPLTHPTSTCMNQRPQSNSEIETPLTRGEHGDGKLDGRELPLRRRS